MEEQEPQWVRLLRRHSRARTSFVRYIQGRIDGLAATALGNAASFDQVLGMRYAAGELEALKYLIEFEDEEIARHGDI